MENLHSFSPLETLVLLELETLRMEQEELGKELPWLTVDENIEGACESFVSRMNGLRERATRLQRLLDGMEFCGFDEDQAGFWPEPSPVHRTAA